MPRPVILFTGPFSDIPLAQLALKAAEWGYSGVELCSWGDHLEVQRVTGEPDYAASRTSLLSGHDLECPVVSAHRVGQAVCDPIDQRHQKMVPDYVWGDGDPSGIQERAAAEVIATVRAAQELGATTVSGFSGCSIWSYVAGYPGPSPEVIDTAFQDFAHRMHPILDACQELGLRFAYEVHPGQMAFDLYSAERVLESLDRREEFGFTLDPSHLHWQGVDPVAFMRQFPDRIYHVHIKDAAISLDGKAGLLNSYFPYGDPRRGWEFRSPGRGGIDWERFFRGLNQIGYEGPLAVDWRDDGMVRDFGAEEACRFVKQLDFPSPPSLGQSAFHRV